MNFSNIWMLLLVLTKLAISSKVSYMLLGFVGEFIKSK